MIEKPIPNSVELSLRRALLKAYETNMPIKDALNVARELFSASADTPSRQYPIEKEKKR